MIDPSYASFSGRAAASRDQCYGQPSEAGLLVNLYIEAIPDPVLHRAAGFLRSGNMGRKVTQTSSK